MLSDNGRQCCSVLERVMCVHGNTRLSDIMTIAVEHPAQTTNLRQGRAKT